ncbi:MAG: CBS domain-containing protein [Deltaproteobacteria bacterium]|nr:CBS domain-containing protein [Deltaproteobacteria bacterium]
MTRLRYLDKAQVKNLMTSDVVTLSHSQSVPLAEAVMKLKRVRHLPVVSPEGALVGLVTHRDLLRAKLSNLTGLTEDERTDHELRIPVSSIMRTDVWTIGPNTVATKAANMLRDHSYGCLPVVEGGKLVGILTEADFVDAVVVGEREDELPAPTVSDAMTPNPLTMSLPATIGDARALMEEHGIRHLPLAQDGELVGLVSDRDLHIADTIAGGAENVALGLIGTDPPYVVDAEAPFHAVLNEMSDGRRGSAMVVEDGKLVGIVTTIDACRYLAEWLRANYPQG